MRAHRHVQGSGSYQGLRSLGFLAKPKEISSMFIKLIFNVPIFASLVMCYVCKATCRMSSCKHLCVCCAGGR